MATNKSTVDGPVNYAVCQQLADDPRAVIVAGPFKTRAEADSARRLHPMGITVVVANNNEHSNKKERPIVWERVAPHWFADNYPGLSREEAIATHELKLTGVCSNGQK